MVGKAVTRVLLILALIVTAHTIKPFSIKNVTQHLLYSSRSFKFVLPAQWRDNFDHANYLAINLSGNLFEAGKGAQNFADFGLVAIKAESLDEANKSATKQKPAPKKSAPAKRVIKTDKSDSSDLIASVNWDEIMPVELPPAPAIEPTPIIAPYVQPCATKLSPARSVGTARVIAIAQTRPIEALVALRKNDCEIPGVAQESLFNLIEQVNELKKLKTAIWVIEKTRAEKPGAIASECEEQGKAVVAEELQIEVAEPEEKMMWLQKTDEVTSNPFSTPFENRCREP